jgi:hypothetical protein
MTTETAAQEKKQTTLVREEVRAEAAVRKGYCLATFVKPIPDRDKKDHPLLTFEISFPLTDDHKREGVLPDEIREAWDAVLSGGLGTGTVKRVIDSHDVKLRLVPDSDAGFLEIKKASIKKASISIIKQKGTGKSREVIRLQVRVETDLDKETWQWAGLHFGHTVWIRMYQAQGNLLH